MTLTSAGLALWLALDVDNNVEAMCGLVDSTDLRIVTTGDLFSVIRSHGNIVSRFEIGRAPILPSTMA